MRFRLPVYSFILSSILSSILSIASAQNPQLLWRQTYGSPDTSETCVDIEIAHDGGYILLGRRFPAVDGMRAFLIYKVDSNGNLEWSQSYGYNSTDRAAAICATSDSGYVIAGSTGRTNPSLQELYIFKIDIDGNLIWEHFYYLDGNTWPGDLQPTADGGFICTASCGDAWLIKLDALGNIQWYRRFGGIDNETEPTAMQTTDGGCILGCRTLSMGGGIHEYILIIKTDAQGNLEWSEIYGSGETEWYTTIKPLTAGGYVVASSTFLPGSADILMLQLDAQGTVQSCMRYGGPESEICQDMIITSDQGFLMAGSTESFGSTDEDLYCIKTDSTGYTEWVYYTGSWGEDCFSCCLQNDTGDYILGGNCETALYSNDMVLFAFDDPVDVSESQTESNPIQITPNPFNPSTEITFQLSSPGIVNLTIYDVSGRNVATLIDGWREAGSQKVTIDGSKLSSGIYFAILNANKQTCSQKLVLLK